MFLSNDSNVETHGEDDEQRTDQEKCRYRRVSRCARETGHFDPEDQTNLENDQEKTKAGWENPGGFDVDIDGGQWLFTIVFTPLSFLMQNTFDFRSNTHGHEQGQQMNADQ